MHALRQKCRPKHQVLILKCYPKTTKGAVDVKPNSSELSYLLYYATTRRSKVQKVGAFLEKKTASDVWRARIGNVQVTLQILAALIEKAPRDLPLYAPYVLKILNIILRSRDITMVESSILTFEAFCEYHDGASLSADQEYLQQYEEIVRIYASFASTRPPPSKAPISAPVAMRWRSAGLQAIKSVASSEALASLAGKQLDVIVPILLENIWTDNGDFLDTLTERANSDEQLEKEKMLRRRTSIATVRTFETSDNPLALSGTIADADKLAEEDIGVLAIECLKHIFVVNNRPQIHGATTAVLQFIADRVAQNEKVIEEEHGGYTSGGWATRIYEMIARWTPVQDRYVILVTAMDVLVRSPLLEDTLQDQLVLATMVDSLLKSDINLIGLSVMDVLLGLIQHVLRVLQLDGAAPHFQQSNGTGELKGVSGNPSPSASIPGGIVEASTMPTDVRMGLLSRLQACIGNLATHVYYADQISDMVSAILLRLKPSPLAGVPNAVAAIENPNAASAAVTSVGELSEDPTTDGFFSFDTAKVKALEAIKAILLVASHRKSKAGGSLGRNRVPVRVWEGTQWLLRDSDGRVRKAYVDALLTWLEKEMTKSDLRVHEEKSKALAQTSRDDSAVNLTKRAVSNASHREKTSKPCRNTFLPLLHLAVYENALQFVESESDIILIHLLLSSLVMRLGVNAAKNGLPMVFRLQEDIMVVEAPIAKIRIGSLCHGYFWALSEKFDFDTSPVGRAIQNEVYRRRKKTFWVDRVSVPPLPLSKIDTPGQSTPPPSLPLAELESGSLLPFDDRFQMVKLISLSYSDSIASPPQSAPTSPGRSFSHPILSGDVPVLGEDHSMPDGIKDTMMSEWSRESVIAQVQETSKTVSLNGSKTGTNTTGHRNFLAVNGGTGSGTQSPQQQHHAHSSKPNSTYGLVGGLGAIQKIRKSSAYSPSPASESSRNSVTRVAQLKRVLSGQRALPGTPEATHSDASSESMVSYDFTASEVSYNPAQQNVAPLERSVSQRQSNDRARSKSRDRNSPDERARPLNSNPVLAQADPNVAQQDDLDYVPPVPPLPASLTRESTLAQNYSTKETPRKGRSIRKGGTSKTKPTVPLWGEDAGVVDLETLLNGIETGGEQKGNVAKPPY